MTIPAPEFEWVEEIDTSTIASPPEAGAVFTGRVRETDIRRFHLRWDNADDTKQAALEAEWDAAIGEAGTTTYTPTPRGEVAAVTVQFDGQPTWKKTGGTWQMACVLREEYTPY